MSTLRTTAFKLASLALFIGGAMVIMMFTIGVFGERTRNRALEEISH